MKPPPRKRRQPQWFKKGIEKNQGNELKRRKKSRLICSWQRTEQRYLMLGLRKLRRGCSDSLHINFTTLKETIRKRSVQEIESMVELLKKHVVEVVLRHYNDLKRQEKAAKVPLTQWSELAGDLTGSLDESIAMAFSQMLVICSTEPQSLRHSYPPHEVEPLGTPSQTDGCAVPLRPMSHAPVSQRPTPSSSLNLSGVDNASPVTHNNQPPTSTKHDGTPFAATAADRGAPGPNTGVPASTAGSTTSTRVTVAAAAVPLGHPLSAHPSPGTNIIHVSTSPCSSQPGSSPLGGAIATQVFPGVFARHCPSTDSTCTSTSTTSLSTATTSSSITPSSSTTTSSTATSTSSITLSSSSTTTTSFITLSSSSSSTTTSSITPSSTSTTSSSSTTSTSSGFGQKDSSRTMNFEKIYMFLSSIDKPEQEREKLSPMESAVLLDLLLSLPEELPLLNCSALATHMTQVYNHLTSRARPTMADHTPRAKRKRGTKGGSLSTIGSRPVAMNSAGSRSSGTNPNGQASPLTDTTSQSGGSAPGTLSWEKAGICPLNLFMVPMHLLARRQ